MKYLISDDVLTTYSYIGQSKRKTLKNKSFMILNLHNLIFCKYYIHIYSFIYLLMRLFIIMIIIIDCIKTTYAKKNIEDKEIKGFISSYLDSASTRIAREKL